MDSSAIKLNAVGDIMLGDNHLHIGRGVGSVWAHDSLEDRLKHITGALRGDIVIGNLECILGTSRSRNPLNRVYIAPTKRALELQRCGFTHISLANNHILDHGYNLAMQTESALKSANISVGGRQNPIVSNVKGQCIAFFCYSLVEERHQNDYYQLGIGKDDLKSIKATEADFKVVLIHWGDEYSHYPSPLQIELGERLIENGVRLIIGHHPHVVQGIWKKDNAVIAYSLGNFIFDQNWSNVTRRGLILEAKLHRGDVKQVFALETKQNEHYMPRISDSEFIQDLSLDVHAFRGRLREYKKYAKEKKKWARVAMKAEIVRNFSKVSIATLAYPIIKRSWALKKFF